MATVLTAVILFLIGLALGGGGIRLAMLGGSWYYVIAGLAS
jgi:quinoprotein glucose dehydrogenase